MPRRTRSPLAPLVFGDFELDPASGELRKGEACVRLSGQPLKLLLCLLDHPGKLVPREELQQRLWGDTINVDFDDGLNSVAWRLRQALGDSSDVPTYIETIPRKGYRFVGKVSSRSRNAPLRSESVPLPVYRADSGRIMAPSLREQLGKRWHRVWQGAVLTLGLAAAGAWGWSHVHPAPSALGILPLRNATGDAALDYFARALETEVARDLKESRGIEVTFIRDPQGEARSPGHAPMIEWSLLRDQGRYCIAINVIPRENGSPAGEVFITEGNDLPPLRSRITDFIATHLDRSTTRAPQP